MSKMKTDVLGVIESLGRGIGDFDADLITTGIVSHHLLMC